MELSDIVSATCSLMGKQILRFEDIFEELDFDSSVLRKIVKHLDVGTILGIIGAIPTGILVYQVLLDVLSRLPVHIPFGL